MLVTVEGELEHTEKENMSLVWNNINIPWEKYRCMVLPQQVFTEHSGIFIFLKYVIIVRYKRVEHATKNTYKFKVVW